MCGIAGMVNFDGRPVHPRDLHPISEALAHRGPDGEGACYRHNVGLAHRRLAIIDPHTGMQPFYSDDQSLVLSYNGEIYNYLEIRRELEPYCHFRTHSDTEVVLRAYEQWGIDCLQRFRGMFAFALYDSRHQGLYLVRDRLGIKPLYYYHEGPRFLFASELSALLKHPEVKREINPDGIAGFFRYQYVPTPATIYEQAYKLEPGHFLHVDIQQGIITKRCYWRLGVQRRAQSEGAWLEALNAELDEIIRLYVRSDVPFGAFLSGGVDSSLVTALMAKHLSEPVRTFTVGFSEKTYSELPYAAEASRVIRAQHYEKKVSSQLALDVLRQLVVHFGEPFGDSSAVPTSYVAREAAQHVKMVLSGDGGDELFGGYQAYVLLAQEYGSLPAAAPLYLTWLSGLLTRGNTIGWVREGVYRPARSLWRRYHLHRPAVVKAASQAMQPTAPTAPFWQRYDQYRSVFREDGARQLLHPDIAVPTLPLQSHAVDSSPSPLDPLTCSGAQDVKTYLLDDILTKVDRTSMAHSLEVRVPLLDHQLVEFAFSMPPELKVRLNPRTRNVDTKYLLKQSASRFYSETFLNRPKMGFGIPVAQWLRAPLGGLLEEELSNARNPIFDWLQFGFVQDILARFFAGDDSHSAQVWCLLMFSLWMKDVHRDG